MELTLKELAELMNESLVLRGQLDSLDEKISKFESDISTNKEKIAALSILSKNTEKLEADKKALDSERGKKQAELNTRLQKLEDNEVKLPIKDKLSTKRTSL